MYPGVMHQPHLQPEAAAPCMPGFYFPPWWLSGEQAFEVTQVAMLIIADAQENH